MKRRRTLERLVEGAMAGAAFVAVLAVVLIFAFVIREASPLLLHPRSIGALFGRSGDASYAWQPVGKVPKLDAMPLVLGSLKITTMTMLVSAPLAIAAALAASEVLRPRARQLLAPLVEMLAGIPSVVLGLLAALVVGPWIQSMLGTTYAANALVASIALSIAVAPIIFAVSLEGFLAVPKDLREASYALGARRYQTALNVVLPAAAPAVVAALTLGFGRAIGETMIVLMASGNAAVFDLAPTSGARTITATIAAELGETAESSHHWSVLFFLGLALMTFTLALDWVGRALTRVLVRRQARPHQAPSEKRRLGEVIA